MATDLISRTRTVMLEKPCTISDAAANDSGTEADIGAANNGLLIITLDAKTAGTDAADNVGLYTSATSNFTEAAANRVTLTQNLSDSVASCTLTTNEITAGLSSDGVYVFEAANLKRFVNVEFDGVSGDTTSKWSVILVTTNIDEAPYKPATPAY